MSNASGLVCIRCARTFALQAYARGCPHCAAEGVAANLGVDYAARRTLHRDQLPAGVRSMWRYGALLPASSPAPVTLGEGGTPLVPIERLGLGRLLLKDETRNPTWSFKDRLASSAITMACQLGARVICSSSSGNAGAAIAAYAARAELQCVIVTYRGASGPMVAQMQSYGAKLVTVPTSADRWRLLSAAVEAYGWYPASVYYGPAVGSNPFGIEGYKTIAYEIAEALDWRVPDWCVLPVCYGDALYGMWKGFEDMVRLGWTDRVPRLVAAEVSGSLTEAMTLGVEMPAARPLNSVAGSISAPQGTYQAVAALRAAHGTSMVVDDEEMLIWRARVAQQEGVFLELSAAATFPVIEKLRAAGTIGPNDVVVALATAGGLKDVRAGAPDTTPFVDGDLAALTRCLKDSYGFDAR